MNVLVIDNYDSFTWNLVQYLQILGAQVEVVRNDAIAVDEIRERAPDRLLISPDPATPIGPASPWKPSPTTPVRSPCWASAWDTSPSDSTLEDASSRPSA